MILVTTTMRTHPEENDLGAFFVPHLWLLMDVEVKPRWDTQSRMKSIG